MKEEETVKWYSDRIIAVVNNIRLLGNQFSEARTVEKVISTLPERYEAKISSLEDSRDLTNISLTELINVVYAQEQRRASRQEKYQECKLKQGQPQQPRAKAQVAEQAAKGKATKGWLIDSDCTNHMTPDAAIFKSIDRNFKTRVKVGIEEEGKGEVLIDTSTGNKLVSNVLSVPEIDRNLLSIAQLLEKGYSVVFKGKECLISDPSGYKLMLIIMADKSFVVD
ncbi:uncharacterized protein [Gossypium hirsutum]|uniref:Retrovirus-related Pol polyprotein from transposon TNT 1-94-like beta-barrel domain-containing protein n=1 Tax=Gossypium hirsutum TaxID=3635 RepID=A0ABM2ZHW1_GOSHI|nr:uncharacterized protein LOC121213542 [Gossypium hirsutum]